MGELGHVLLLALFPAAGNILGGLLAELIATTRDRLSIALHMSAGIIFAVIAIELAPRVFEGPAPWFAMAAFFAGGMLYVGIEDVVERLTGTTETDLTPSTQKSSGWVIYAAVAVDLFSDGLLVGTGSSISLGLAVLLALGQIAADLPEGFATVSNFKAKGMPRRRRLLLSLSLIVPSVGAALLAYLVLRNAPAAVQLTALAFTAGLLLVAAAEEIIGQAHEAANDTKWSTLAISGGFVLFAAVSMLFGA